jgi:uncharacterized protein
MKISRYVFVHEVEPGWWGLYTPFKQRVCFVSNEVWQRLSKLEFNMIRPSSLQALMDKKIVVNDSFDDTCLDDFRRRATAQISAMFLVVAQDCNLACRYCVVQGNVTDQRRMTDRMTVQTAKAAIDLFSRLLDASETQEARVTYYGGEPLLNPEVIKATIPLVQGIRARSLTRPVGAVVITNGMIYDEETANLLKEYAVPVAISLDGMAEQHDAARVTKAGTGSHATILGTMKRYQDKGLQLAISCTIGKHNVRNLADIARFVVREFGIREIEFQMPYVVPNAGNEFYIPMAEATEHMLAACDVMIDELGMCEFTTLRRLETFANVYWRHRDCGAVGGQIVVSPTGKVGPCHSLVGSGKYFNGDVNDPTYSFFDDPLFKEWTSRIPVNMPDCEGCAFIALCGGGCAYNALTSYGTIWAKDPQVCPYLEKFLPWILERLWRGRGCLRCVFRR